MLYLIVLGVSAAGMLLIVCLRMAIRSRRLRSVVSTIQHGTAAWEKRIAKDGRKPAQSRPRLAELRNIEGLLREARLAMMKKSGEGEVERLLVQALTIDPHAPEVMGELSSLYLRSGKELKAEVVLRDLVTRTPDSASYASLGFACEKQGKFTEAVEAYKEALQRDPHSRKLQLRLARGLINACRVSDAVPILERITTRETHDIDLLFLLAECYEKIQNRASAREAYEKLSRLQPANPAVKEKVAEYALLV
jgi:predicted Zn-dependent protease